MKKPVTCITTGPLAHFDATLGWPWSLVCCLFECKTREDFESKFGSVPEDLVETADYILDTYYGGDVDWPLQLYLTNYELNEMEHISLARLTVRLVAKEGHDIETTASMLGLTCKQVLRNCDEVLLYLSAPVPMAYLQYGRKKFALITNENPNYSSQLKYQQQVVISKIEETLWQLHSIEQKTQLEFQKKEMHKTDVAQPRTKTQIIEWGYTIIDKEESDAFLSLPLPASWRNDKNDFWDFLCFDNGCKTFGDVFSLSREAIGTLKNAKRKPGIVEKIIHEQSDIRGVIEARTLIRKREFVRSIEKKYSVLVDDTTTPEMARNLSIMYPSQEKQETLAECKSLRLLGVRGRQPRCWIHQLGLNEKTQAALKQYNMWNLESLINLTPTNSSTFLANLPEKDRDRLIYVCRLLREPIDESGISQPFLSAFNSNGYYCTILGDIVGLPAANLADMFRRGFNDTERQKAIELFDYIQKVFS